MVVVYQHHVVYKIIYIYIYLERKKTVKEKQDDKDNEEIGRKRTCLSFRLIIEKKKKIDERANVHVSWMLRNEQ